MTLPKLYGHQDQRSLLDNTFAGGSPHHAWIFNGPKGIGKHLCALHFARSLFSQGDSAPGLEAKMLSQAYPDLLQVSRGLTDSGNLKMNITVDEVRKISAFACQTTVMQPWRVVIVDEAELLNRAAGNAILKVLEEPPPKTLLILVTSAIGVLLPTIRSRCQVLNFRSLSRLDFQAVMGQGGESETLYQLSGGSPGQGRLFVESGAFDLFSEMQETQSLKTLSNTLKGLAKIEETDVTELLLNHWVQTRIKELALKNVPFIFIKPWFDLQREITVLLTQKRQYTLDANHVMSCILFEIKKCMESATG